MITECPHCKRVYAQILFKKVKHNFYCYNCGTLIIGEEIIRIQRTLKLKRILK